MATLIGLRVYHPILAFLVVGFFAVTAIPVRKADPRGPAAHAGLIVLTLMLLQLLVGWINVTLRAPIPLQMVHLLLTDLIWIGAVLFLAEMRGTPEHVPRAPSEVSAV